MLIIRNLEKAYAGKPALKGIDLVLPRGQIVGLFGENGAGKTTLMKCILGFLPHRGQITLDGAPVSHKNIEKFSFATSEHSFFPNLSADAHRDFYKQHFTNFSEKRFGALMDFFALPRSAPLRSFSMGQKNQFEVILSLCQGADYILMDEPFAGNDLFNREDFYKVLLGILDEHETVLLSTHLIEEVSGFISRAVLLKGGQIVGDVTTDALEEAGSDLVSYIKETYNYRGDRVARALGALAGKED